MARLRLQRGQCRCSHLGGRFPADHSHLVVLMSPVATASDSVDFTRKNDAEVSENKPSP